MQNVFKYFLVIIILSIQSFLQTQTLLNNEIGKLAEKYYKQQNQQSPNQGGSGNGTEAVSKRTLAGSVPGGTFGMSAASAGDVNGDGFNDIIVGAPRANSITGMAFIFYGGAQLDASPDVILSGEVANDWFGYSLSTAGDCNGDGFDDVIIGAYGYNDYTGKVYIYYGGSPMNGVADIIITGESSGRYFGESVTGGGDIDGDGYADVMIGAAATNSIQGKVYVLLGRAAPLGAINASAVDFKIIGETGSALGKCVAFAGDVNGDGYCDMLLGAPEYNAAKGRAYIFFGKQSFDLEINASSANVIITGQTGDYLLGSSLASAGDMNGDGLSDVIIATYPSLRAGLFLGGNIMDNIVDITYNSPADISQFARTVAGAGDVNADGFSDIIIGDHSQDSYKGKAYVYYGGLHPDNSPDIVLAGEAVNTFFGFPAAGAGDINGDGFDEILVGAYGSNSSYGKVYIYYNSLTGNDISDMKLVGEGTQEYFGYAISSANDVNGDGYDDIIVGASGYSSGAGRVSIFFGGPQFNAVADITITGGGGTQLGAVVAGAGDVNNDGYDDVLIGTNCGVSIPGTAYLFYGGPSFSGTFSAASANVIFTGMGNGSKFGSAVCGGGDLNGDGFKDIIIGAPSDGTDQQGIIYLYYGGASMSSSYTAAQAPFSASGYGPNYRFGTWVAGGGDANNDGFADFLVGAPGGNKAYIYFGGGFNTFSNSSFTGADESQFGFRAAFAGDINLDGFTDVLIGTLNTSIVYLYCGGVVMDNTADIQFTGVGEGFGWSVSSAGDVNSDGYADVLIGAFGASKGCVYFGGPTMDNTVDITMIPEGTYSQFGQPVANAGDINGDGVSDLLVSDMGFDTYKGRVYVYLSSPPTIKPRVLTVVDMPKDQGGKITINFVRSAYDIIGMSRITSYLVQRGTSAASNGFWEDVGTLTARKQPRYMATLTTPADSVRFFYRVVPQTSYTTDDWKSNAMAGMSIDNLAPSAVKNLLLREQENAIRLSWTINTDPDFKQYVIYRNSTPSINTVTAVPLSRVVDTIFVDSTPLTGEVYYFVAAQDIHNNIGPVVNSPAPNAAVNLSAFIEGFYNEQTDEQIADTIKVYLCSTTAPYEKIDSATALLSTAGAASVKFFNTVTGNYYLVINHRNSIETWSKLGGEAVAKGASINYNFCSEATQAFGNNLKQKGSRWCLYSGDANQDGIVDFGDLTLIDNDSYNFMSGYLVTDVNGDQYVDFGDLTICDNNSYNYVQVMKPGWAFKQPANRGILRTKMLPQSFVVSDNYPNPFNPSTKIDYALPK
ncbi:MAG: FG-GAP repeat protein, partial [Ignavibacteriales bacterium]|nr:FG-GAP repeat protein [Ignavibacteriales bacterium]